MKPKTTTLMKFTTDIQERVSERFIIKIPEGTIGELKEVRDDETHIYIPSKDITIALHSEDVLHCTKPYKIPKIW